MKNRKPIDNILLRKTQAIRKLSFGLKEKGGRSYGLITFPRRGSLTKRLFRFLDERRSQFPGEFLKLIVPYIYDPNRTGYITLIMHANGIFTYILAVNYLKGQRYVGNLMMPKVVKEKGYSNVLSKFQRGSSLNTVNFTAKAAGTTAMLLSSVFGKRKYYTMRLCSGEYRIFIRNIIGTFGAVCNEHFFLRKFVKLVKIAIRFSSRVRHRR